MTNLDELKSFVESNIIYYETELREIRGYYSDFIAERFDAALCAYKAVLNKIKELELE